jgi:hypothetical protein
VTSEMLLKRGDARYMSAMLSAWSSPLLGLAYLTTFMLSSSWKTHHNMNPIHIGLKKKPSQKYP